MRGAYSEKNSSRLQYSVDFPKVAKERPIVALLPHVLQDAIRMAFVETVVAKRPGRAVEIVHEVGAAARIMVNCR